MPAHSEAMINGEQMDWLLTYISDPAAANAGATALSGTIRSVGATESDAAIYRRSHPLYWSARINVSRQ